MNESPAVPTAPAPAPELDDLWSKVVEAVGRASPFARSYLLEAHPVSFGEGSFIIGFDPEFADHLELVDNTKNRTLIQTKLKELGCGEAQVRFVRSEAPARQDPKQRPPVPASPAKTAAATAAPKARSEPASFHKDDFKNDPLIQKALEIFKGQIVDVRA